MLISVEVGKTGEVVEAVQKLEGVRSADSMTAPYDVAAAIEVADLESLGSVIKEIHSVTGGLQDHNPCRSEVLAPRRAEA